MLVVVLIVNIHDTICIQIEVKFGKVRCRSCQSGSRAVAQAERIIKVPVEGGLV